MRSEEQCSEARLCGQTNSGSLALRLPRKHPAQLSQSRSSVRDLVLLGEGEFGHGAAGSGIGQEHGIVAEAAVTTRLETDTTLAGAVHDGLGAEVVDEHDGRPEPRRAPLLRHPHGAPAEIGDEPVGDSVLLGMNGSVDIEVESIGDAVTVPVEAVLDEAGKSYVYLVQDGKAVRTEVTTGRTTDTRAEVLSGVAAGDDVIVTGIGDLKDGAAVRVK